MVRAVNLRRAVPVAQRAGDSGVNAIDSVRRVTPVPAGEMLGRTGAISREEGADDGRECAAAGGRRTAVILDEAVAGRQDEVSVRIGDTCGHARVSLSKTGATRGAPREAFGCRARVTEQPRGSTGMSRAACVTTREMMSAVDEVWTLPRAVVGRSGAGVVG